MQPGAQTLLIAAAAYQPRQRGTGGCRTSIIPNHIKAAGTMVDEKGDLEK